MSSPLVLDCSVAAKWVLPEPDRVPALRLLEQYESGEISLIAPDLLLAEFASVLANGTAEKRFPLSKLARLFNSWESVPPDC